MRSAVVFFGVIEIAVACYAMFSLSGLPLEIQKQFQVTFMVVYFCLVRVAVVGFKQIIRNELI